jgi:hypothetical protein
MSVGERSRSEKPIVVDRIAVLRKREVADLTVTETKNLLSGESGQLEYE